MALRVVSAIMFYPRGGSSHAARALADGLRARGCSVTLVAGSRSDLGSHSDARAFYGQDVRPASFDAALASEDPIRYEGPPGSVPVHPSFEDRPGAPDRVFAALDDLEYEHQVRAWSHELASSGAAEADVIHLHHLTPLNEAAARVAPSVPVVGQLHGTELLMLERIASGAPPNWTHADRWARRLRSWARRCCPVAPSSSSADRPATCSTAWARRTWWPLPARVHLLHKKIDTVVVVRGHWRTKVGIPKVQPVALPLDIRDKEGPTVVHGSRKVNSTLAMSIGS